MTIVKHALLSTFRALPLRAIRHRLFMRRTARVPPEASGFGGAKVLILGVYLADRINTVEHLAERFASADGLEVEQRWMSLKGAPATPRLESITRIADAAPAPKFALVNRLLEPGDVGRFDFIIVCDDDIFLPRNFLPAFIAYQRMFDFAIAQPSRAWHSHFDLAFVLRRPGLLARQTRFVESGPMVSFRRDAARLLMPFDAASQMWGLDFVWPDVIERQGLTLGIVDKLSVDHSLRPQATSYKKAAEDAAMHRYLSTTPHLSMAEAFTVLKRHRATPKPRGY